MVIKGWGLKGTTLNDVEVLVDGVACKVTKSTLEEIYCVTGSADVVSIGDISQPGNPGLTYTRKDPPNDANPWWGLRVDSNYEVVEKKLVTAFEHGSVSNWHLRDGMTSSGWFKPPATGRYRFLMSCDDACQVFLNTDKPWNKSNPEEAELTQINVRH